MTQISDHVYACHIADTHYMHPGGTTIYFIGDPSEEMLILDTGEHDRSWTKQILEYWEGLGSPKIGGILISHGHGDHTGGLDRIQEATGAPVRCHPKLAKQLRSVLGHEDELDCSPQVAGDAADGRGSSGAGAVHAGSRC